MMKLLKTSIVAIGLLVAVSSANAAKLSLNQHVYFSFVNGEQVNNLEYASRKTAQLEPGRYQIVVVYGNNPLKSKLSPYHSMPNILNIDVDERDLKIDLPVGYRNPQTARYNFERTPQWFISYQGGEKIDVIAQKVDGTVMEYDDKIASAYAEFAATQ